MACLVRALGRPFIWLAVCVEVAMPDILRPWETGTSQGDWDPVGGALTIADAVDTDSDSECLELDVATEGDYFDVKMDNPFGQISDGLEILIRVRAKEASTRDITIKATAYIGDPSIDPVEILATKEEKLSSTFDDYEEEENWINVSGEDFTNLWVRVEITKVLGTQQVPDITISRVEVEVPSINKSAASPQRIEPVLGNRYHINLWPIGGERVRKADFKLSPTGEGNFYRRTGELIPGLTVRDFEVTEG